MKDFCCNPFKKNEPEIVEVEKEESGVMKIVKVTLIVLGVIAAVVAICLVLYRFFKKYFVIDFDNGEDDDDCFAAYDIPEDEDFAPKCDLDAENE